MHNYMIIFALETLESLGLSKPSELYWQYYRQSDDDQQNGKTTQSVTNSAFSTMHCKLSTISRHIFLFIVLLVCAYPLFWMVLTAFKLEA